MISYATLGTSDMDRAIAFFDAVFAPLEGKRVSTSPTWTGYARKDDRGAAFFLTRPYNREAADGGNGGMLAFLAPDRAAVDSSHAAALTHAGVCEGPPGVRLGMNPVFYAAYVRDPDGNKLCFYVRQ